ncbi:hypothetical protein BJV78DRAFT_919679 [Lactifluus subvellereus]|nr:hypothetical protein BJV78DRAFT_919679 [Lactifluus subvellereus]
MREHTGAVGHMGPSRPPARTKRAGHPIQTLGKHGMFLSIQALRFSMNSGWYLKKFTTAIQSVVTNAENRWKKPISMTELRHFMVSIVCTSKRVPHRQDPAVCESRLRLGVCIASSNNNALIRLRRLMCSVYCASTSMKAQAPFHLEAVIEQWPQLQIWCNCRYIVITHTMLQTKEASA